MPLKLIGPPCVMVIVPRAKRVGSSTEVATIVTSCGVMVTVVGTVGFVGTTAGEEYTPLALMEPHPVALPVTVQVGRAAKALGVVGVVLLGVVCVRDQVTPWDFKSLVRIAKKGCCSFVGTA